MMTHPLLPEAGANQLALLCVLGSMWDLYDLTKCKAQQF